MTKKNKYSREAISAAEQKVRQREAEMAAQNRREVKVAREMSEKYLREWKEENK